MGAQRVQVNVELEDGAVRERVRFRDDATGTDVRFENGTIVSFETDDDGSGVSGSDDSGHDATDDHGGVSGSDDSGHDATDDHGGDRSSDDPAATITAAESGRGGADDPPGDDHGTDD